MFRRGERYRIDRRFENLYMRRRNYLGCDGGKPSQINY